MVLVSVNVRKGKERGKGEKENIVRLVTESAHRSGTSECCHSVCCGVISGSEGLQEFPES